MNGWLQILRSCMIVFISILAPPRPYTEVYKTPVSSFSVKCLTAIDRKRSLFSLTSGLAEDISAHKVHHMDLSPSHPLDQRCRSRERGYLPPNDVCKDLYEKFQNFLGHSPQTAYWRRHILSSPLPLTLRRSEPLCTSNIHPPACVHLCRVAGNTV